MKNKLLLALSCFLFTFNSIGFFISLVNNDYFMATVFGIFVFTNYYSARAYTIGVTTDAQAKDGQ